MTTGLMCGVASWPGAAYRACYIGSDLATDFAYQCRTTCVVLELKHMNQADLLPENAARSLLLIAALQMIPAVTGVTLYPGGR